MPPDTVHVLKELTLQWRRQSVRALKYTNGAHSSRHLVSKIVNGINKAGRTCSGVRLEDGERKDVKGDSEVSSLCTCLEVMLLADLRGVARGLVREGHVFGFEGLTSR